MSKKLLIAVILVALPIYFYKEILVSYAAFFSVDNATKGADAILLLAGNSETRAYHAAKLYKEGYAPIVLVSDPKTQAIKSYPFQIDDSTYSNMVLGYEGIGNVQKIPSLKGGATSTFDEAIDLIGYLKEHPMQRVILVTDTFHTKRALYAFNKIANLNDVDILFQASAAKNSIYDETNWYKNEAGITSYVLEGIKFFVYLFRASNIEGIKES